MDGSLDIHSRMAGTFRTIQFAGPHQNNQAKISNGDGWDIFDRVDYWLPSQLNDQDTRI